MELFCNFVGRFFLLKMKIRPMQNISRGYE
jgi:hypothetical protein